MAVEFEIADRRIDDHTYVVAVAGEIDLFTVPEFKDRIAGAIENGVETIVVDLTDTTFIDSSSLGVLISAHRRLHGRGGSLRVACTNDAIIKTFRITGLDGVLTLADSVESALEDEALSAGS